LPYPDAEDCRIKLMGDARFDLACRNDAWLGTGSYTYSQGRLVMTYSLLSRSKRTVTSPQPLSFKVEGRGNSIRLTDSTQTFVWTRSMH
jgi:hypothetical protein